LDFDQGLVGPFRSVERGFELCGRYVVEEAVQAPGVVARTGEAGHRVVPEMQVVDEAAEQLGHDHDVVLEHLKPRYVEAFGGFVTRPHPESGVAALLGRGG